MQRDSDGHKVILRLVKDYSDGATLAMQVYIGKSPTTHYPGKTISLQTISLVLRCLLSAKAHLLHDSLTVSAGEFEKCSIGQGLRELHEAQV